MLMQFKLGMEAVCSVHDLYLRFTLALTDVSHTDECNENHIKDISNQYLTAQYVMENACRWVNTAVIMHYSNTSASSLQGITYNSVIFVQFLGANSGWW